MLYEKHNLNHEFPDHSVAITNLKSNDPEFAAMAKQYHKLDHQICGLEANEVPTTDANFMALKSQRIVLKDQIYQKLINGDF